MQLNAVGATYSRCLIVGMFHTVRKDYRSLFVNGSAAGSADVYALELLGDRMRKHSNHR